MMQGEYRMRTLKEADAQTQSASDRIEDNSRPSKIDSRLNTSDLPHLAILSWLGQFTGHTISWCRGFKCPRSHTCTSISAAL